MIGFYRIFFIPILLCALPYYLWRMLRRGGYGRSFHHRFGLIKPLMKKPSVRRIWLQAVSVGEMQAIQSLIDALCKDKGVEVILTTTTSTGYAIAEKLYAGKVAFIGFFPLDFWPFSWLAWHRIAPDCAVLMDSELWPEHLYQARRRGVPVLLLNGRLSDRTFARYRRFGAFPRMLLKDLYVCASNGIDYERFLAIGARPDRTSCTGNLKFDTPFERLDAPSVEALRRELGFSSEQVIVVGSSTWEGEEALLVQTLLASGRRDVRLLLIPRHVERRHSIIAMLQRYGVSYWVRSDDSSPREPNPLVYLADTTGEAKRLMQAGDVVYVGKSLPPHRGGQSPIEAAASAKAIIYGPDMSNFRAACHSLEAVQGALRTDGAQEAQSAILELLQNLNKRKNMSQNALDWFEKNRGATERALQALYARLQ